VWSEPGDITCFRSAFRRGVELLPVRADAHDELATRRSTKHLRTLNGGNPEGRLDLGCVASRGHFTYDGSAKRYVFTLEGGAATAFCST
jgi:hypothetical protein